MSSTLRRAEFATGASWRPGLPPGVYEARAVPAATRLVRLDTAAFIGLAQRGPLNTPVPVESAAEFARAFGAALPGLAPAHRGLPGTTLRIPGPAGWHRTRVTAAVPAGRGTVALTLAPPPPAGFDGPASAAGAEEVLLRFDIALGGRVLERWDEAGLDARHPRFLPRLLGRRAAAEALLPPMVTGADPETRAGSPDRIWGGPEDPAGSDLLCPSALLEHAWLVPSGAVARHALPYPHLGEGPADLLLAQQRVVEHCETLGTRIALLDLPPRLTSGAIADWRRALTSGRAALYAPWLLAADAGDAPVALPPAAVAAGIVARTEAASRPWGVPANQPVLSAVALLGDPGLPDAGFLHEERIDVIRPTERGLLLLGSRTTALDPDWTHLSVRRLFDWLQAQLLQDLAFAPFEPNGPVLWASMARAATRRLRGVFDAGALAGRSAAEAFFVRCDASTTPRAAQDAGQAIMLVGAAPAVPAEFIVFRPLHTGDAQPGLEVDGP